VGDAAAVVAVLAEGVTVVGAQDDQPAVLGGEGGDQAGEVGVGVGEGGLLGGEGVSAVAEVVAVGDVGRRDVDEQVQRSAGIPSGDVSTNWPRTSNSTRPTRP
jgi:hypothetical protein